jgi:TonB family protein
MEKRWKLIFCLELFSGERNVDNEMLWTATTKTAPSRKILPEIETDEIFDIVEEMPLWKACDNVDWTKQERRDCSQKELLKFIYTNIKYPTLALENDVSGTAVISFVIEKDGSITNETILRNPGAGTGEEALRVIKMLPNFISGRQRGKSVRVRYNFPVRFRLEGLNSRILEKIDSTILKQKFTNDSTINTASTRQIDTYLFGATSLGWINCDRFIGLKRDEKTSLFVESTTNYVLKNGDVKLIFRNLKTIMNNTKNGKKISFDNIPKSETVITFALKFENNQYYMGLEETVTKANQTVKLNFELVTLAKLKATM